MFGSRFTATATSNASSADAAMRIQNPARCRVAAETITGAVTTGGTPKGAVAVPPAAAAAPVNPALATPVEETSARGTVGGTTGIAPAGTPAIAVAGMTRFRLRLSTMV